MTSAIPNDQPLPLKFWTRWYYKAPLADRNNISYSSFFEDGSRLLVAEMKESNHAVKIIRYANIGHRVYLSIVLAIVFLIIASLVSIVIHGTITNIILQITLAFSISTIASSVLLNLSIKIHFEMRDKDPRNQLWEIPYIPSIDPFIIGTVWNRPFAAKLVRRANLGWKFCFFYKTLFAFLLIMTASFLYFGSDIKPRFDDSNPDDFASNLFNPSKYNSPILTSKKPTSDLENSDLKNFDYGDETMDQFYEWWVENGKPDLH